MNRKLIITAGFVLLLGCLLTAEGKQETKQSITVYIAASTTDLMEEIGGLYTDIAGVTVNLNPASSGTLARQIEQGAPADVYVSASKKWMDYVEELGVTETRAPFVTNRLVLIVPEDSALSLPEIDNNVDLPSLFSGRLSMGDPEHVPAGKYAMEALKNFGWYAPLESRILPGSDVRAAMAVVELGETEIGIVYETDAKKSSRVKIAGSFPEESHTPIAYFIADLKGGSMAAREFTRFVLESPEAQNCSRKYGFSLPE